MFLTRSWHHLVLLAWLALWVAIFRHHGGHSWHYFATGSRSLLCLPHADEPARCGLHVYAVHPELQIGPLSLLLAGVVTTWQHNDGVGVAEVFMALAGWAVLLVLERDARRETPQPLQDLLRRRVLLAGLVFLPVWTNLAVRFAHLDDVLALLCTTAALYALTRCRPTATGLALALATLAKPWAIAFLPLVLALPRGRRLALCWAVLPVVGAAALFLLADPHTLTAARFAIPNVASSSLRTLGVSDPNTPGWDRPAQFGLGMALAALAVHRSRWRAVVMVASAVRIMLDPSVYSYYTAGILLGAVVWDIHARRGRVIPAWSWLTFGALFACRYLQLPDAVLGATRLTVCLVIICCALWLPPTLGWFWPWQPSPAPARLPDSERRAIRRSSQAEVAEDVPDTPITADGLRCDPGHRRKARDRE